MKVVFVVVVMVFVLGLRRHQNLKTNCSNCWSQQLPLRLVPPLNELRKKQGLVQVAVWAVVVCGLVSVELVELVEMVRIVAVVHQLAYVVR